VDGLVDGDRAGLQRGGSVREDKDLGGLEGEMWV
jgi:hypothetical protein